MKENKKYRVFTDDVHEYNIQVYENKDGYDIYELIRTGLSWSEHARGETVLTITNDGNGYHMSESKEFLDYADVLELLTLLQFAAWYESKDSSNKAVLTIESCKEKFRFTI